MIRPFLSVVFWSCQISRSLTPYLSTALNTQFRHPSQAGRFSYSKATTKHTRGKKVSWAVGLEEGKRVMGGVYFDILIPRCSCRRSMEGYRCLPLFVRQAWKALVPPVRGSLLLIDLNTLCFYPSQILHIFLPPQTAAIHMQWVLFLVV